MLDHSLFIRMPEIKSLMYSMSVSKESKRNYCLFLLGISKGTITLTNVFQFLLKIKLTI